MAQRKLRLCMPSTAHWAALPLQELDLKPRDYLQLSFALPGAPSYRVEICEFAILLRFSLSSGVGRGEEKKRTINTEPHCTQEAHNSSGDGSLAMMSLKHLCPRGFRESVSETDCLLSLGGATLELWSHVSLRCWQMMVSLVVTQGSEP